MRADQGDLADARRTAGVGEFGCPDGTYAARGSCDALPAGARNVAVAERPVGLHAVAAASGQQEGQPGGQPSRDRGETVHLFPCLVASATSLFAVGLGASGKLLTPQKYPLTVYL